MKKHYLFFVVSFFLTITQASIAQITTVPASSGGAVSICQNGSIIYSSSANPPAGATILWDFPGGVPSSASTLGPHPVAYATPGTYTATLTINGVSSAVNVTVAPNAVAPNIAINPSLLGGSGYGQNPADYPDINFYYCGNIAGAYNGNVTFQFVISSVYPATHQIVVNWGDGTSTTYPGNTTNIDHIYNCSSVNQFVMSVTVLGPSGCVASVMRTVYSGIAPTVGVTGGSGNNCVPASFSYTVNAEFVPGTTYTYSFNIPDTNGVTSGTIPPVFPTTLTHVFSATSCGINSNFGPQTYNNADAGIITATNVCGVSTAGIAPIYVSTPPIAQSTITPANGRACQGQVVQVCNTSGPGTFVSNGVCSSSNNFYWTISPNSGFTLAPGQTLGNGTNPTPAFWTNGSQCLNVTFNTPGNYTINLFQGNGCGTSTDSKTICIVAPVTPSFTPNSTIGCAPFQVTTTNNTTYTASCPGDDVVYSWAAPFAPPVPGACNVNTTAATLAAGSTATSFQPSYNFPTPGVYNLQLTASLTNPIPGTQCAAQTQIIPITVTKPPIASILPFNVCAGSPVTIPTSVTACYDPGLTYSWTIPGATPNTSTSANPTVTYTSAGSNPISVTVSGFCGDTTVSSNVDIVVNQVPTISITAPGTMCQGGTVPVSATVTPAGLSVDWTVDPATAGTFSPINGTTSNLELAISYFGPTTITGTTTGSAVCPNVSETISLNVPPVAQVFFDQDNQTVCSGDGTVPVALSSPSPDVTFSWTLSPPAQSSGFNVTSGSDTIPSFDELINFTNNPINPLVATFNCIATPQGASPSCPPIPFPYTITINPNPTVNPVDDLVVCNGQNVVVPFTGTGSSYGWTVIGSDIGLMNGTGQQIEFTAVNTTNAPITVEVEVVAIFTGNNIDCDGNTSTSFFITVNPSGQVNVPGDIAVCDQNPTPLVPFTTNNIGGTTTYNWSYAGPNIGQPAPVANPTNIPSFTGTNATVDPLCGVFTIQSVYTSSGLSCPDTTDVNICILPTPIVDQQTDVVVCSQSPQPAITFTGTGTTYNWVSNSPVVVGNLNETGFDATNAFTTTITGSSNDEYNTITVTPIYTSNNLSCPGSPMNFDIIVLRKPIVFPVESFTICNLQCTDEMFFTGTGDSFVWTYNNPATAIGAGPSGGPTFPAFCATNASNIPTTGNFSFASTYTLNGVTCSGNTSNFQIIVNPTPTTITLSNLNVCNGVTTQQTPITGTASTYTWQVTSNTALFGGNAPFDGSVNNNATFIPSFTPQNFAPAGLADTAIIEITPNFVGGGIGCAGAPQNWLVIVSPIPTANPINDIVTCPLTPLPETPFSGTGTSYNWTSNPNPNIVGIPVSNGVNSLPTFTTFNPDDTARINTITVTPIYTVGNLNCPGPQQTFDIIIHPTPIITPIQNFTVCNFGEVNETLQSNIPATFSWTSSTNPNVIGNTTTNTTSPVITNSLVNDNLPFPGTPQPVIYTANATSLNNCPANPMSFVVNVMPTVVMTSTDTLSICTNNLVGLVLNANVPSSYVWSGSGPSGGLPSVGSSGIIDDVLINPTNGQQLNTYLVTPTSLDGNCIGIPQTVIVLVTPPPALVSIPSTSVCSGQAVNYEFVANAQSTFTWYGVSNPNVQGISINLQQGPIITDVLINPTLIPQQVTYRVVITTTIDGNCSSQEIDVIVAVNPIPQIVPLTQEICPNGTVNFLLQASEPSTFLWIAENNINVTGESQGPFPTNFIQNTLYHELYDPEYVYYHVTPTSNTTGCVGPTVTHTAIVNPYPNLIFDMPNLICTSNDIEFALNPVYPLDAIWNFGNGQQSNQLTPTTIYTTPGPYIVTVYGINPVTGCNNTVFVNINVLLAPEVDFSVSETVGCVPALFQFFNTANNQGSTFQWDFGDGTISNQQGLADHYYNEAGCFDVTMTATAPNGCPNRITYEDMVCAYNIPIAGIIVNDPIQYADVNEFIFENVTLYGHTYFWDLGDGTTSNAVHPGHIYPMERNIYNVTLIATNEAGCTDTTMVSIQVKERLLFYVPNSFTPDGNNRNEVFQPVFTLGYDVYSYELMIFNRWGETMFESYNDKVGWDGTYGGDIKESGTYMWRIRFRLLDDEDIQEYYGHVNLLR